MNIKNINKKGIIITLGLFLIILIVFLGSKTYFKQQKSNQGYLNILANLQEVNKCEDLLENNSYAVCCIRDGKIYDCSNRKEFKSGEEIQIIVDSLKIPEIQNNPDFNYVCLETDILRKSQATEEEFILFPEECFMFQEGSQFEIKGIIPEESICMSCRRDPDDPNGIFTLLRIDLYSDPNKDIHIVWETDEVYIEKDHLPTLNLKAKLLNIK